MLPPHFPDPDANPIALLEARIAEQDEIIAAQYREMKAWQEQLEAALERLDERGLNIHPYIARPDL